MINPSILSLAFSPCPNDTFMFDAMVNGKIETEGLEFNVILDDVETLNRKALKGELDITKLSYATYPQVQNEYIFLDSGSALGFGTGPLLVSKEIRNEKSEIKNWKIAIPGSHTTANLLFSIFFPEAKNKIEMIFSEIEDAVLSGKADAGVIIHENRFTYQQKGLKKIADLGELWEKKTNQPIPLGGIVVKRNLASEVQQKINRVLRRSVEYAFANPDSSYDYVKSHAQEMDEEVRKKHIALYVNDFSIELGPDGRAAIATLFQKAEQSGMIEEIREDIFLEKEKIMHGNL
jgi:1,4-dihydroxy-6-naphthoate synthase